MDENQLPEVPAKRGKGRPKGSKNRKPWRAVPDGDRVQPEGTKPFARYKANDPLAMAAALYTEVDWQLQALRNEREKARDSIRKGEQLDPYAPEALGKIATTLERAMKAHDKALTLADRLAKQKTPEQLLRIAIEKVKGQDLPTVRTIIRELKNYVLSQGPLNTNAAKQMGATAASAIGDLGEDD